jgi:hypothetical protein
MRTVVAASIIVVSVILWWYLRGRKKSSPATPPVTPPVQPHTPPVIPPVQPLMPPVTPPVQPQTPPVIPPVQPPHVSPFPFTTIESKFVSFTTILAGFIHVNAAPRNGIYTVSNVTASSSSPDKYTVTSVNHAQDCLTFFTNAFLEIGMSFRCEVSGTNLTITVL